MSKAFDFHAEVKEEEQKAKENAESKRREETESAVNAVVLARPTSKENPNHAKSGGGLFSAGGGAASAHGGLSRKEAEEKIIADKKKKKFGKLFGDEPEPQLKIITAAMMEAQRKTAAKKKRAERRAAVMDSLQNKGVDDGKGAQKLLTSYVDEVLTVQKNVVALQVPQHVTEKKSWQACSFIEKLTRTELKEIPLVSQVMTQKGLVPVHTQLKKKQFNDVCTRLDRNDGAMIRLRLNGTGVSDSVVHMLSVSLEKNLYAQHLMLHDNRITDVGLEELCTALRWHPSVHTLWLGGNPVTDRGCIAIANLVHVNHNIKDINLSNKKPGQSWAGEPNIYTTCITHLGCDALSRSLMRGCQLISINLADQRIRDQGATLLFSSLRKSVLRTLNLKNNLLTDKCCVMLRDVLIYESAADGYGKHNIGNSLNSFSHGGTGAGAGCGLHLEKLSLAENTIGDAGAANIAYALCYNKTLHALDLSFNAIGDAGIAELLSCLQFNQVLRSMYTVYNTSDDERVDRILEMRTAAVQALEDHLDRADRRETFHDTGLLIDRTGTITTAQRGLNRGRRRREGGVEGGSESSNTRTGTGTGTGTSAAGSGEETGDARSPNSRQQRQGQGGNAAFVPQLSPSQLADSLDSRNGFGFDLDSQAYGAGAGGNNSSYMSGGEDSDGDGDPIESYGSRVGTADTDIYRQQQDSDAAARSRAGTSHSRGRESLRLRPVPAFLPATTTALKQLARESKRAARDTQQRALALTAGLGSLDGFGSSGSSIIAGSEASFSRGRARAVADSSAGGSRGGGGGRGYMLHDGNKYGDEYDDVNRSTDSAGGDALTGWGGAGSSMEGSATRPELSREQTIGSNLSTGQTGKQLTMMRPNTSGSVIDSINVGRHRTDAAVGVEASISLLSTQASFNTRVNLGSRGTPQKPIDWSQVALPAHLLSIARLASDQVGNRPQNFHVKERRELYKALGNFVPRSARKPPVKSGGGRAGAAKRSGASTAPAGAGRGGEKDKGKSKGKGKGKGEEKKATAEDDGLTLEDADDFDGDSEQDGKKEKESGAGPGAGRGRNANTVGAAAGAAAAVASVVDQFPPNPNPLPPTPQSPTRSGGKGKIPSSAAAAAAPGSPPARSPSPPKSALRKASSFNSFAATSSDRFDTGGDRYSAEEIAVMIGAGAGAGAGASDSSGGGGAGAQASVSVSRSRARSGSPSKSTRFKGDDDDLLHGTGHADRGRAGTPGGFGGRLSTPGPVIGADDDSGGGDPRITKSAQEQHAEALARLSDSNEAIAAAVKLAALPGSKNKGQVIPTQYVPLAPVGRVSSAGSASGYGISGRASPARPFRSHEDSNDLTDIFFRPKRGGNTHENVEGSMFYKHPTGKRPTNLTVADFKSGLGDKMWNRAMNAVGLSTAETRLDRDSSESAFASKRHSHSHSHSGAHSAPAGETHHLYGENGENGENGDVGEADGGWVDGAAGADAAQRQDVTLLEPGDADGDWQQQGEGQEGPEGQGGGDWSPPRSPNRAGTGTRGASRVSTALQRVREEEGEEEDEEEEGDRGGGGEGEGEGEGDSTTDQGPAFISSEDREQWGASRRASVRNRDAPDNGNGDGGEDGEEEEDSNNDYGDDGSDSDSSQSASVADGRPPMAVPPKAAAGYGGDMLSFFSLFLDPNEASSGEDEDDGKGKGKGKGKGSSSINRVGFEGEGAIATTSGGQGASGIGSSPQKNKMQRQGSQSDATTASASATATADGSATAVRKAVTESSIMTTEELEEIQMASITERMRLGSQLPNSTFKRLFDKTGKPVLSKELGKTLGVPKLPAMGIRPVRSATTQFRDSGTHLGYLRIATPDDPPGQRPISLMDVARQQKNYRAKVAAERQSELYKELKKDAHDRIPRAKQRAAAYPIPDKFWEAWRRDNRLRYPQGIDRAKGTSSTNIKDLARLSKNADGTVRMDANARERLLVKTPGQALVYRRKEAKRLELDRQRRGFYDDKEATIGQAKRLVHDLLGLREDQSTTDLLNKKDGLTRKTGIMEARPIASIESRKGKEAFKAPKL